MKIILKQYLSSLKERKELDALFPHLLSEMGLNVLTLPSIGTRQYGVDIAAVGRFDVEDKTDKLCLFSLKAGDFTRGDWDGSLQAIRPSLNEIMDFYIPNHIPAEHSKLDIVIYVAMGGDLVEAVNPNWSAFTKKHETTTLSIKLLNGDKIADLLMKSLLGKEVLDEELRFDFQKSIAMVDIPEVSIQYFNDLFQKLLIKEQLDTPKAKLKAIRQIYICLWVLFSWAKDVDNLKAPMHASEEALLLVWDIIKDDFSKTGKQNEALQNSFMQVLWLYIEISETYFETKIYPYTQTLHGLSTAVNSSSKVDVNLAMFELLGQISLYGLWVLDFANKFKHADNLDGYETLLKQAELSFNHCISLLNNNPTLNAPLKDDHVIEIILCFKLAASLKRVDNISSWIEILCNNIGFSLRVESDYPSCALNYRDLLQNQQNNSEQHFENVTKAGILYPFLFVALGQLGNSIILNDMVTLFKDKMSHCTLQLWVPDRQTDNLIWRGDKDHGKTITFPEFTTNLDDIYKIMNDEIEQDECFSKISAVCTNMQPLLLTACRHYRMPIPPHLWF